VLDEAVSQGVGKFLLVSSAHATGRSPDQILCESTGDRPETPYAQAKLESEELAISYAERNSIDVVILRPPGIYGPGDKSVVSSLGRAARMGLWLPLKGLEALHSLIFVDNLARAGLALLKVARVGPEPRVLIIKDPIDYQPGDLYVAICRALGKRTMLLWAPLPLLRTLGSIGARCQNIPRLRGLGLFQQLTTSQRYCGHLFNETLPDFRFVSLDEALQETLGSSAGVTR
jgi:nucleoside-diphosphate-sugar epimerase